jgi:hypothetical protein
MNIPTGPIDRRRALMFRFPAVALLLTSCTIHAAEPTALTTHDIGCTTECTRMKELADQYQSAIASVKEQQKRITEQWTQRVTEVAKLSQQQEAFVEKAASMMKNPQMPLSTYEYRSLILTGIYDLLTLCLLWSVIYEALIKPRQADLSINFVTKPADTKSLSESRPVIDFVIENRGTDLRNVVIKSEPDFLGWGSLGANSPKEP